MNFLVLADCHCHNFAQFANPIEYYGNTRFMAIARRLEFVFEYALANEVDAVFICGDLFHTRGMVSVTVQSVIHNILVWAKGRGLEIHILAGNHDQANKSGSITSLDTLKTVASIHTEYSYLSGCAFIPFREQQQEMIEMFDQAYRDQAGYVFAHAAVNGAYIGDSEYQPKEQLEVVDIKPERFKWVWLGHYHKPQLVAPNMAYCGSLCGHNFTDTDERGFWEHQDGCDPIFHPIPGGQFITITLTSEAEAKRFTKSFRDNPDNYYKIKHKAGLKLPAFEGNVILEQIAELEEYTSRIQDVDKLSDEEVIQAYVVNKGVTDPQVAEKGVALLQASKK